VYDELIETKAKALRIDIKDWIKAGKDQEELKQIIHDHIKEAIVWGQISKEKFNI